MNHNSGIDYNTVNVPNIPYAVNENNANISKVSKIYFNLKNSPAGMYTVQIVLPYLIITNKNKDKTHENSAVTNDYCLAVTKTAVNKIVTTLAT